MRSNFASRGDLDEAQRLDLWDCLLLTNDQIAEFLKHVKTKARLPHIFPMFWLRGSVCLL